MGIFFQMNFFHCYPKRRSFFIHPENAFDSSKFTRLSVPGLSCTSHNLCVLSILSPPSLFFYFLSTSIPLTTKGKVQTRYLKIIVLQIPSLKMSRKKQIRELYLVVFWVKKFNRMISNTLTFKGARPHSLLKFFWNFISSRFTREEYQA